MDRNQRNRLRRLAVGFDTWLSRRRMKVILAMAVLAALALAAFLGAGRLPEGDQVGQLLYQVSADLVGSIVVLTVITPLIQTALREDVTLRDRLDLDGFVEMVREGAHETVNLLDSFSMVLAPNQRYGLIYRGLEAALGRGAEVRVLLLEPGCAAAERRHDQLAQNFAQRGLPQPRQVMYQSIRQLREFEKQLPAEWRERFEARFTTNQPIMHVYQCDKLAFISFPRGDRPSNFERQLEVDVLRADIWVMVSDHFNELWLGATALSRYAELSIRVALGDEELPMDVEYVRHDERLFVYDDRLVGRITEALLTRRVEQVHATLANDRDVRYAIGALYRHSTDEDAFEAIAASFRNKYGVERSVVFSMTPDVAIGAGPGTELATRDADVPRQRVADEG